MQSYECWLRGSIPSKKNRTVINKGGRLTYGGSTHTELDRLALQIPPELRDLRLRHPKIEIQFYLAKGNRDRDNLLTSVLDLLVKYGVLENDSTASCNGTITVYPAKKSKENSTHIKLWDAGNELW